ncbi:hypothetical protein GCM10009557_73660 [Virgisporangium ochraceum]
MSRAKSVGCYGGHPPDRADPQREIWVYDTALSLVLAHVIRAVERLTPDRRPVWWADHEHDLRVQVVVSDLFLDLTDGLDAAHHGELARLLEDAAAEVRRRGTFTAADAAAWPVLGTDTVPHRDDGSDDTAPAAELGEAMAALLRGTLPPAPAGSMWFDGPPGGRTTIVMQLG